MKFGHKGKKYGPYGIIEDDEDLSGDDEDELSSLASDEVYSIDENGKRYKRKKKGFGEDDIDEEDAGNKNLRLDKENRLEDMFK